MKRAWLSVGALVVVLVMVGGCIGDDGEDGRAYLEVRWDQAGYEVQEGSYSGA